jgi:hypothetical protein
MISTEIRSHGVVLSPESRMEGVAIDRTVSAFLPEGWPCVQPPRS